MESKIRVLIVEDFKPFRQFISSQLQSRPTLQVVSEVSDGLEAVEKVQELQPALVLLDIGLPTLNGIQVARRIRKCSPGTKILFVTENRSPDIVEEAFATGAGGYVVKSDAASELLLAVDTVLQDKIYVNSSFADRLLAAVR